MIPGISELARSSFRFDAQELNVVSRVALNCLASLAIAVTTFRATRLYGSLIIHIYSGVAFALACNILNRRAPSEGNEVLSEETIDQVARSIWVNSLVLGSVFLGTMSADLLTGGKVLLAGIKRREALEICQGITSLSWQVGYIMPITKLLLRASLPFADRHQGLLRRIEEAAPGHLLMEDLLAHIRGFSQRLFFQNLSISVAIFVLGCFIDLLSPIRDLLYLPTLFFSSGYFFQAQRDVVNLGIRFFLGVLLPALEGRADLGVLLDSQITFLDETSKRRWFRGVLQSNTIPKEKLFEILKKFSQDFSWDFLALHLPEEIFREYIKPELTRFEEGAIDLRFVGASEEEEIKKEIARLKAAAISVQETKEKKVFDQIQKAARCLAEKLEFSANLTASFPKALLPSPPYYDVNEIIQKTLPNKELLHSLRSEVLVTLEGMSSAIAAGAGQESIIHFLTQELGFTPEDFWKLGVALSIPAPELVKDRSKAVAARLRELGLVSRKDLKGYHVSDYPSFVEACKTLEREKDEEESFQVLSDDLGFNTITFRLLGIQLGLPLAELDGNPIGVTAQRLCERGLSTRKDLKDKGILARLPNGESPTQVAVIQRIRDACKKYEEENHIESAPAPELVPGEVVASQPQLIDPAILGEENWERFRPDRIRMIFARALKWVLIFTQISKSLPSTTLGFLVGMVLPEGRFPYFEGRYWSVFNMSQLYDLDPSSLSLDHDVSSLSLDHNVFALSRAVNQAFQAVVMSLGFSPLGGLLSGITHARVVRRIPHINESA